MNIKAEYQTVLNNLEKYNDALSKWQQAGKQLEAEINMVIGQKILLERLLKADTPTDAPIDLPEKVTEPIVPEPVKIDTSKVIAPKINDNEKVDNNFVLDAKKGL